MTLRFVLWCADHYASEPLEYGYIAYIDKAGDPRLSKVRPIDEGGASEGLVLSAVVMKASREEKVIEWAGKNPY